MSALILPGRFNKQPQYAAPLDKRHWLTKDTDLAINFAAPNFNAATGQQITIVPGGSGFTRRATSQGMSLYTPNGGWASVALNKSWGGGTLIVLCRVNGIDNPWGGLLSKNYFNTNTQFAIGRESSSNSLYGAVDDATALSFGGSTIASLSEFSVLAFTHSGAASSAMSYYHNGVLAGTTGALGTQASGAAALYLGVARDFNAAFDSDVDWLELTHVTRVLSGKEIAEISSNVWATFQAPSRRLWGVTTSTQYTLVADSSEFAITGTAANLEYSRLLAATQGSFAVTAAAAALKRGYALQADPASFALSGTDAGLKFDRTLQAGSASSQIAGTDASLEYNRVLSAESGSFETVGTDATFVHDAPGSYTPSAESASLGITAQPATLKYNRRLSADAGAFAFTGTAASLRYARAVITEAAVYALTGTDATLTRTGGPESITSTVERTAVFRAAVERAATFKRNKNVNVRFN